MRDTDIRKALRSMVEALHDPSETLVLDELEVCQGMARIDLAVVNGLLHGYEIKSDADTLNRLPAQINAYSRVLERVTIVCGRKHLGGIRRMIPKWWGIILAEELGGSVRLKTIRREYRNPQIDLLSQAQLLWRDEALAALERRELAEGLRSKPRKALWLQLVTRVPSAVSEIVRESLKARVGWRAVSLPA